MTRMSATMEKYANSGTARSCGERRKGLRLNSQVMQISRSLFPIKTSQHLSDLTGYSVRSCEYWLSEKAVIPSDALASLMQSHKGRAYLVAVMADSTPRWWLLLKAWIKRIDYEAAEIAHRKHLRELLDEEAARSHPPAFLVQDEAFYEGQPSPPARLASKPKR